MKSEWDIAVEVAAMYDADVWEGSELDMVKAAVVEGIRLDRASRVNGEVLYCVRGADSQGRGFLGNYAEATAKAIEYQKDGWWNAYASSNLPKPGEDE